MQRLPRRLKQPKQQSNNPANAPVFPPALRRISASAPRRLTELKALSPFQRLNGRRRLETSETPDARLFRAERNTFGLRSDSQCAQVTLKMKQPKRRASAV